MGPLEPSAAVGGVATLHDAVECGGLHAVPNWPSEALAWRREALRAATNTDALGACSRSDDAGGWLPAERAGAAHGFRVGSSQWRRASADALQRAAAEEALQEERRRSDRFFHAAAAAADVERAREAEHWRVHVHQACRAVDRRRLHSACTPRYADAAPGQEHEDKEDDDNEVQRRPPPQRPTVAVGYRPGSAAARRAAGGLYAASDGHSHRLVDAVPARTLDQEKAAQRAVDARLEARSNEAVAAAEALAQREAGAAMAVGSRAFGDHAERVAVRRTMHLGLNMPTAPQQRLHRPRPNIFDPGHMAACW